MSRSKIFRRGADAGPLRLAEVLGDVVGRLGLERNLDDYRIWVAWDEVVGATVARNAQPVKLSSRRLVVAVKNATWMHELSLLRHDLCKRLNAWMGRDVVTEIFLVVGRVEPSGPTTPPPTAPPTGTSDPRPANVNEAIERLWTAIRQRDKR